MSNTSSANTMYTVVRVLLMDQQRQQVVLCNQPGVDWYLPCGELPEDRTPRDFLATLVHRHLPQAACAALQEALEVAMPDAWLFPPALMLPYFDRILQVVYLLTLNPSTFPTSQEDAAVRFWPVAALPEAIFALEPLVIRTVCLADACNRLPLIDLRPARKAVDDIAGIRFARYEPVKVIGGEPEADSVEDYVGCEGKVIGVTNTLPRWFCVRLDDGRQIAALPHHLQPEAEPELAGADRRPLASASQVWPGQPLLDIEEAEANLQTLTRSLRAWTGYSQSACRKALQALIALSHASPTETIIALLHGLNEHTGNQAIVQQFRDWALKEEWS